MTTHNPKTRDKMRIYLWYQKRGNMFYVHTLSYDKQNQKGIVVMWLCIFLGCDKMKICFMIIHILMISNKMKICLMGLCLMIVYIPMMTW